MIIGDVAAAKEIGTRRFQLATGRNGAASLSAAPGAYTHAEDRGLVHERQDLIEDGARVRDILFDEGEAEAFLPEQLKPSLFAAACADAGISLTLRLQPGYDHRYYFIATFMEDHLRWHGKRVLTGMRAAADANVA